MLNTAAAGNLHTNHSQAFDMVFTDDFGQLFAVIDSVQLGAADKRDLSADKIRMETAVCVGCAVSCNQKVSPSKYGH